MRALLLVDFQNDFMPGGAAPVPQGDEIVSVANRLIPLFELVVATQDWHPADHSNFASQHPGRKPGDVVDLDGIRQILWPDHCVQGSPGAALHEALDQRAIQSLFFKGVNPTIDSYSAFFDNGHLRATGLGDYLQDMDVTEVVILGLSLDFCVKFTALDGRALGFEVTVVRDGTRAVNVHPCDDDKSVSALRAAGVKVVDSATFFEPGATAKAPPPPPRSPSESDGRAPGIRSR